MMMMIMMMMMMMMIVIVVVINTCLPVFLFRIVCICSWVKAKLYTCIWVILLLKFVPILTLPCVASSRPDLMFSDLTKAPSINYLTSPEPLS